MNEDVTQELNVDQLYETEPRKRSIMSYVIQYIGLLAVFIGIVHVTILCAKTLAEGTKDIVVHLTLIICFGLYPLIMGLVLRRQALNKNRNYSSGYLICIGFGALMGWLGLIIPMPILVGGFEKTIENPGLALYVIAFLFSVVLLFSGAALVIIGLGLGRDAEAAPAFPDR